MIASREMFEELILTRFDKARTVLDWGDQVITVRAQGKKLGDHRLLGDPRYEANHECKVRRCDAHSVFLYDFATDRVVSEPWKNVTITQDTPRDRPMLIVQPG